MICSICGKLIEGDESYYKDNVDGSTVCVDCEAIIENSEENDNSPLTIDEEIDSLVYRELDGYDPNDDDDYQFDITKDLDRGHY